MVSVSCESVTPYVIDTLRSCSATLSLGVILFLRTLLLHTTDVLSVYHDKKMCMDDLHNLEFGCQKYQDCGKESLSTSSRFLG